MGPFLPLLPLLRGPQTHQNGHFHKLYLFSIFFVIISYPLAKNYVPMTKNVTFGAWGPFYPFCPFCQFQKGPQTHQTWTFSKTIFFSIFFCHIEPICQNLCFYDQICDIWPLGHFLPLLPILKGPQNSSKMDIFKIYIYFFIFPIVTFSLHTKNICYAQNCDFWS